MSSTFELGLFRFYEHTIMQLVGPAGTILEDDVEARARRSRQARFTTKLCTGFLTISTITIITLVLFLVAAHLVFIGPGSGTCLPSKLAPYVNHSSFPKDIVLRLRFGSTPDSSTDFVAEYEFSRSAAFATLTDELRTKHLVQTINITLAEDCISSPFFASLVGHDTVIINQLLFGLLHGGNLHNLISDEWWNWTDEQIAAHTQRGIGQTCSNLFSTVSDSIVSFFLVTSITALLIRILLSSGVIALYPLFYIAGRCRNWHNATGDDIAAARNHRNLTNMIGNVFRAAYPWLGSQIIQLHARHRSVWPLVIAHLGRVVVYWTMYEACQIVWNLWFYNKSVPAGMLDWMPAIFLMIEYYSMLYVRSRMSMKHYPRLIFVYFMCYTSYFHSTLYGLYVLNVLLFGIAVLHTSCWFVYRCEIPAFIKQDISEEVPRAHVAREAVPSWSGGIPSEASVFHPVTETARTRLFIGTELERRRRREEEGDGGGEEEIGEQGGGEEGGEASRESRASENTAAVHGLSALMQMAGVSFNPSTYTEVPREDEWSETSNGTGETKTNHNINLQNSSSHTDNNERRVHIEVYGTSSSGEDSSSDDEDNDFGLLSRP